MEWIPGKLLRGITLSSLLGEISSYNVSVTADELWRHVGRILRDARETRRWSPSQTARRAGIDGKTITAIEAGEAGNVAKLQAHAEAFGMTIVDVLSAVLDRTKTPLSPEARQLLRRFERISVPARSALLLAAQAYPDAVAEESPAVHPPPDDPRPTAMRKR